MSSAHSMLDFATHLLQQVPDPPAAPPPGKLQEFVNTVLGWMKWFLLVAGVIGLLICAGMIILGRRQRNAVATEGLISIAYVIGGLALVAATTGVVGAFL